MASQYFITEKTSETGKKFQAIAAKRQIVREAALQLAKKYGFQEWRSSYWSVFGGISSCSRFDETPDSKIWGKGAQLGEYYPKKNSKIGKTIHEEFKNLPIVSTEELNMCVGFDGAPFSTIGYSENNDVYFGFSIDDKWEITIPKDCEEVTLTKYKKELFFVR